MGIKERIFHAILFEALAVSLSLLGLKIFTEHHTGQLFGMIVLISAIAMAWNFVFNWTFDQFFTGNREDRSLIFRLFHTLAFELGLLFFTLPLIMFILNISFIEAFLMDLSMTIFIIIYTFLFNLSYDNLHLHFINRHP